MKTPTIYEIKDEIAGSSPYFFSPNTMASFGQTLEAFTVARSPKGRIFIYAPMYDYENRFMGYTFREFTGGSLKNVRGDGGALIGHYSLEAVLDFINSH